MGHLDDVHADVDHRPAALQFLLAEDAPVGNSAAAQGLAFDEHHLAELAIIAGADEEIGVGVIAILKTDRQLLFVLLGGVDHLLAFGRIHRHRLFDHDMAAGVGGVDRRRGVHAVGRADADRVGLDFLEHLFPVGVEMRDAIFLLHDLQPLRA